MKDEKNEKWWYSSFYKGVSCVEIVNCFLREGKMIIVLFNVVFCMYNINDIGNEE